MTRGRGSYGSRGSGSYRSSGSGYRMDSRKDSRYDDSYGGSRYNGGSSRGGPYDSRDRFSSSRHGEDNRYSSSSLKRSYGDSSRDRSADRKRSRHEDSRINSSYSSSSSSYRRSDGSSRRPTTPSPPPPPSIRLGSSSRSGGGNRGYPRHDSLSRRNDSGSMGPPKRPPPSSRAPIRSGGFPSRSRPALSSQRPIRSRRGGVGASGSGGRMIASRLASKRDVNDIRRRITRRKMGPNTRRGGNIGAAVERARLLKMARLKSSLRRRGEPTARLKSSKKSSSRNDDDDEDDKGKTSDEEDEDNVKSETKSRRSVSSSKQEKTDTEGTDKKEKDSDNDDDDDKTKENDEENEDKGKLGENEVENNGTTEDDKNESVKKEGKVSKDIEKADKKSSGDKSKDETKKSSSSDDKKKVNKDEDSSDRHRRNRSRRGHERSSSRSPTKGNNRPSYIKLVCVHCNTKCLAFNDYKSHLYLKNHRNAMKRVALRQRAQLSRMRLQQRNAQRDIEENSKDELGEQQFCLLCRLNYRQAKAKHQLSDHHKKMKKFLMPYCRTCHLAFKSPLLYESHRCSLEHIKRKARNNESHSDNSGDEMEVDLKNFTTVDSIGEIDDELGVGECEDIEKNDNGERVNVGAQYVRKVEALYCELCSNYYSYKAEDEDAFIKKHCSSRSHLRSFIRHKEDEDLQAKAQRVERKEKKKDSSTKTPTKDVKEEVDDILNASLENTIVLGPEATEDEEMPGEKTWEKFDKETEEILRGDGKGRRRRKNDDDDDDDDEDESVLNLDIESEKQIIKEINGKADDEDENNELETTVKEDEDTTKTSSEIPAAAE